MAAEKNPLVSVIIPTFNRPAYLRRALASVLNQSYRRLEVIIVDDSSEKKARKDNRRLTSQMKDSRITYLPNSRQLGGAASRNRGLKKAKGKYITFLDDDDEWLKSKTKKQVELFRRSKVRNLGVVYCNFEMIEYLGKKTEKHRIREGKKGYVLRELLDSFCVGITSTVMIKKEVIDFVGGFDEKMKSSQEYDLFLRIADYYGFDFVDEYLVKKHEDLERVSTNFRNKIQGLNRFFWKHRKKYRRFGIGFRLKSLLRWAFLDITYIAGLVLGNRVLRMLNRIVAIRRKK
ncbi:MAG: glycosyltransferase family 2 protein [Candidatus Woesearchaeota archaeon]